MNRKSQYRSPSGSPFFNNMIEVRLPYLGRDEAQKSDCRHPPGHQGRGGLRAGRLRRSPIPWQAGIRSCSRSLGHRSSTPSPRARHRPDLSSTRGLRTCSSGRAERALRRILADPRRARPAHAAGAWQLLEQASQVQHRSLDLKRLRNVARFEDDLRRSGRGWG